MANDNDTGGGANVPPQPERLVGTGPDGNAVNNVTAANRYDIDANTPWQKVHLMSERLDRIIYTAWIPNRRERPDIVVYEDVPYEVYNTRLPVPQYRQCMVDKAVAQKPLQSKDEPNV